MIDGFLGLRSYAGEAQLHRHDHHQLVLPHQGRLQLEVEGRGGVVTPGVGAFIAAGARHSFFSQGANAFVVLDMKACEPTDLVARSSTADVFFPVTAAMQGLLDYLAATLPRQASSKTLQSAWSALLLDSLVHDRRSEPGRAEIALRRAIAFMRAHAAEAIRAADIAAAAGLSTTRLYLLFRARLGSTPHAELARFRLNAAQHLLTGTNLSVAEIAVRTGHADQSALTRALRRSCGVTPA